jgi:hypothetical protein
MPFTYGRRVKVSRQPELAWRIARFGQRRTIRGLGMPASGPQTHP